VTLEATPTSAGNVAETDVAEHRHGSTSLVALTLGALGIVYGDIGTGGIGKVFGPIMLVWFATIALLGLSHISDSSRILEALNPIRVLDFFGEFGWHGLWALGSIFLVVTGGEALYADMGHFGRRPIVVSNPEGVMHPWREQLFALQNRTASSAARFFNLPASRVFEVGTTIEI
jgi:KUP system potassium uptake protein